MFSYFVLAVLLLLLCVGVFFLFKKDILSPSVVSCAVFLFAVMLAILGIGVWNSELELSSKTITVILVGLVAFLVGELVARSIVFSRRKGDNNVSKYSYRKIGEIPISIGIAFLVVVLVFIVLSFLNIKGICSMYGISMSSLPEMLSVYRSNLPLFNDDPRVYSDTLSSIVSKLQIVVDVIYAICSFDLSMYVTHRENKRRKVLMSVIIVVISLLSTILTSGRSKMMKYISTTLVIYVILMLKNGAKTLAQKNRKIIRVVIASALVILPLFYGLLSVVGRETDSDMTDYISFYYGAEIPSLNIYLRTADSQSEIFGNETFYGIQNILYKLKIIDYKNIISREFIYLSGLRSNIYTSLRRYYADFGMIGVVICQAVFGFIVTKMYLFAKRKEDIRYLLFYSVFFSMLIDQVRDDLFWTRFFAINTLYYIVVIYCMVWLTFGKKNETSKV